MKLAIAPPIDRTELLNRALALAGKSIGEIALELDYQVPDTLKSKKGWQGQFMEACLGADSGNLSQPDFAHLNIELKTLPIDFNGKVLESTYVCVLNLTPQGVTEWESSPVFAKLQTVLWVPIAKQPAGSVMDSVVATPFLWKPTAAEMLLLRQDWENAVELVSLGKVDKLNARLGEVLQVRPKAANSRVLTKAYDRSGRVIETLPRGFYLRAGFTQQILQRHLRIN